MTDKWANQSAAANRRPAGQSDDADNLLTTVAADRAFPAAVAELDRSSNRIQLLIIIFHLIILHANAHIAYSMEPKMKTKVLEVDVPYDFKFDPDTGFFMTLVDKKCHSENSISTDTYQSVLDAAKLMSDERLVAFGSPDGTFKMRIELKKPTSLSNPALNTPKGYTSGFRAEIYTDGQLILCNYNELWPNQYRGVDIHDTIILVSKGRYMVEVYRNFSWIEGEQDADLNEGINYHIILTHISDTPSKINSRQAYQIKYLTVPWVGWYIVQKLEEK